MSILSGSSGGGDDDEKGAHAGVRMALRHSEPAGSGGRCKTVTGSDLAWAG